VRSSGTRLSGWRCRGWQGCLKVNSDAVFRDLITAQREHSFDVVGQHAQTAAN